MAVHVFDTMGTTVSLRFAGALPGVEVLRRVEAGFDAYDRRFSLYRPDSELSRVARGELALPRASALLRESYADALDWRSRTAGAFTPHRPDGIIDLNGIVKAAAMTAMATLLDAAGETDWLLNVGGDILGRGGFAGAPWTIGITDPGDRAGLLCTVTLDAARPAVATSGTAERGEHIWRQHPHDLASRAAYRQVTVLAADIVTADVLATAILAGGRDQLDEVTARHAIDVLTVDAAGAITATPRLQHARGLAPA
ncbi:thiamine biosynthesis lipoprotein [Cryobacterium sp. MP_3.1]|uniref:FAD:protein FMN transferase n=1 Tax=Cryobacterium sp. MP_3.1 TaxID=3071711 RepID=UPI002E0B9996|nr:thiamine biosynthesis lipoprotein [Cryobacterium sp. MP_3.1]